MSLLVLKNSTAEESVSILAEVFEIEEEINQNRRWFHANPELSFREFKTAARVVELLRSYGIQEIFESVGRTGVVALIRGEQEGNGGCIALRADMDALPLTETSEVDYKSTNEGVMHACGHDGHTAGTLGARQRSWSPRPPLPYCTRGSC